MKWMKTLLSYMFTGIGIGSVISTVSIAAMNGVDDTIRQVLVWLAASALFGVITWIMYADFATLLIRTVIHFVLCFILAVTAGSFLGYSDSWFLSAKVMLPSFLIIYVIVYVVLSLVWRLQTEELNQKLKG